MLALPRRPRVRYRQRRVLVEAAIDDHVAVETCHGGEAPAGRGRRQAVLLYPAQVELQLRPLGQQRLDPAFGAPAQEVATYYCGSYDNIEPGTVGTAPPC